MKFFDLCFMVRIRQVKLIRQVDWGRYENEMVRFKANIHSHLSGIKKCISESNSASMLERHTTIP